MDIGKRMVWVAAAVVACGCHSSSSSSNSQQKPLLAAFNAAPDMPPVTFLRVEEVWSSLDYGVAAEYRSVDADQYTVHFDSLLPGDMTTSCAGDVNKNGVKDSDECTRLTSTSINVIDDHEYVVALLGTYGNLRVQLYDTPYHTFDTNTNDPEDTNVQVQFFNWSDTLGPVDVYLEPPGTNLSAVQVRATLAAGEEFHGLVNESDYVLTLTAVGDPSMPVYTSQNFTLTKQTRVDFAFLQGTDDSTSPIRVTRFRDQGGDLLDRRIATQLRVTHAASGVGNVDVYAQEDYTQPFVAGLAYQQSSAYQNVDPTALANFELDVTPAGNPGVLLDRQAMNFTQGGRSTFFLLSSATGTLTGLNVQDRFRRLAPYSEVRVLNSAGMSLDFYVIPHGNNVYTSTPIDTLSTGSAGSVHTLAPGSYDIFMGRQGTATYVYGPVNVQLAGKGLYTIVGIGTGDQTRADALLLDDFLN
jgi:Domain of unknown function (DUF4397)